MGVIGKAFIKYVHDEVLERKKLGNFLIQGQGGLGKTLAGAVPLAKDLDPTFEKDVENRYFAGDQYDKIANFYDLPLNETMGKSYIFDEIGISAYSENHAKRVVKMLSTLGQIARISYAFVIATVTDAKLVTSNIRHQYRFNLEAFDKDLLHKKTRYKLHETHQFTTYNQKGEAETTYSEQKFKFPSEYPQYLKNTIYAGKSPVLGNISIKLAKEPLRTQVETLEKLWKQDYKHRQATEMRAIIKGSKSLDVYMGIAKAVSENWNKYLIIGKNTNKLDKQKMLNDFGVTSYELHKILDKVKAIRLSQGYYLKEINGLK